MLAGLTTSEEAYWDDRIHYIDIDASNLGGGIGAMIGSFNNPFLWGLTASNWLVKPDPFTLGQPSPTTLPSVLRTQPMGR